MDSLLDTAPCGFVSFTDDGTMLQVNATLAELLGYTRVELGGVAPGEDPLPRSAHLLSDPRLSADEDEGTGRRDLSDLAHQGRRRGAGAAQRRAPAARGEEHERLRDDAHDPAQPVRGPAAERAPDGGAGQRRQGQLSLHDVARSAHAADRGDRLRRPDGGGRVALGPGRGRTGRAWLRARSHPLGVPAS